MSKRNWEIIFLIVVLTGFVAMFANSEIPEGGPPVSEITKTGDIFYPESAAQLRSVRRAYSVCVIAFTNGEMPKGFESLVNEYKSKYTFAVVNRRRMPVVARLYRVRDVPTFIFLDDLREYGRVVGDHDDLHQLRAMMEGKKHE